MNKQKIVPLAILSLVMLGGAVAGISGFGPSVAHAQIPVAQVQQSVTQKETDKEAPGTLEKAETTELATEAAEKSLPGGGHQDTGETVDHQFEGVE